GLLARIFSSFHWTGMIIMTLGVIGWAFSCRKATVGVAYREATERRPDLNPFTLISDTDRRFVYTTLPRWTVAFAIFGFVLAIFFGGFGLVVIALSGLVYFFINTVGVVSPISDAGLASVASETWTAIGERCIKRCKEVGNGLAQFAVFVIGLAFWVGLGVA